MLQWLKRRFTLPPRPRMRHDYYAHRLLYAQCEADARGFYSMITNPDEGGKPVLIDMWWKVDAYFAFRSFRIHDQNATRASSSMINGCLTLIITMPRTECVGEAHMVGMVIYPEPQANGLDFRYFTLEDAHLHNDPRRTLLCEWVDYQRYCLGEAGLPTEREFRQVMSLALRYPAPNPHTFVENTGPLAARQTAVCGTDDEL